METPTPQIAAVNAKDRAEAGLAVPAWGFVTSFIVAATLVHVQLHHTAHGIYNVQHFALVAFLMINLVVSFWEIGLLVCNDQIREEYEQTKESYRGRELERVSEVLRARIPIAKLLSFRSWTGIWSSYALYDPGYARRGSFGLSIDVGNGWSTPIAATFFALGLTYHVMSARIVGIIGVVMFWQMFYGTVVYCFQFFHAGRHKNHSTTSLAMVVGASNGMWLVFPVWGMAVSVWMILNDSYALFM
jgi:hypothetical protein